MRLGVSRCVLLVLLIAWSAAPAAAGTIVGQFSFERDFDFCGGDPFCEPFEYFSLENVAPAELAGLTFSALIQIRTETEVDGINYVNYTDYDYQFDPTPITAFGIPATTLALPMTAPFAAGGKAVLVFNGGNFADYFGTLRLSNFVDDQVVSARVEFVANGPVSVMEAPSWLVVVIALSALAVGRVFLPST